MKILKYSQEELYKYLQKKLCNSKYPIKKNEKGYYVERVQKKGNYKGTIRRHYGQIRECLTCKILFLATNSLIEKGRGKFCSSRCAKLTNQNPQWKGGKRKSAGYIQVYMPGHPYCNKRNYVLEHRLVMEKHLGRYLTSNEIIHHRNGIRNDNEIENLELIVKKGSNTFHKGKISCPFCGKEFAIR